MLGAKAFKRFKTQAAWVVSNSNPARRLARIGSVTTTSPARGSMRRLTARAR
jgi:hypothetical protein